MPVIDVNGEVAAHIYPAGTVLLGVIWEPWAWDLVLAGKDLDADAGLFQSFAPRGGDDRFAAIQMSRRDAVLPVRVTGVEAT